MAPRVLCQRGSGKSEDNQQDVLLGIPCSHIDYLQSSPFRAYTILQSAHISHGWKQFLRLDQVFVTKVFFYQIPLSSGR